MSWCMMWNIKPPQNKTKNKARVALVFINSPSFLKHSVGLIQDTK